MISYSKRDEAPSYEKFLILSCSDNKVRKWSISENIPVKELEFNAGLYMLSSENVLIVRQRNSATILDYPKLETQKYIDNIYIDSYNPIIPKITISDDGIYLAFIKGCQLFLYEVESWNELWSTEFCKARNIKIVHLPHFWYKFFYFVQELIAFFHNRFRRL